MLLTITPRVIRKNRLNEVLHDLEMETGTLERTYAPTNDAIYRLRVGAPKFTSIDQMEADQRLNLSIDSGLTAESSAKVVGDQVRRSEHTHNAPPAPELTPSQNDVGQAPRPVNDSSPVLSVTPDKQEVASGAEVTLRLQVTSPEDLRQIASGILFNPNILEFVGAEVIQPYTTDVAVNLDSTGGSASIEVDVNPDCVNR